MIRRFWYCDRGHVAGTVDRAVADLVKSATPDQCEACRNEARERRRFRAEIDRQFPEWALPAPSRP